MAELKFLRGLASNFANIQTKDANSFYVVEHQNDTNEFVKYELYLGDELIADGSTKAELSAEVTRATQAENSILARLDALDGGSSSEGGTIASQIQAAIDAILGDVKDGDAKTLAELNVKVQEIADAAKTYKIEKVTTGLSANVKESFKLVDEDGTQVGDSINIYKDSALQKVELVNQELQLTYLTVEGQTEVIKVPLSDFLAESEFGEGLKVNSDGVVSAYIHDAVSASTTPTVDTKKNFLKFKEESDGKKSMVVSSVDTDSTVLQKEIRVAGLSGQFGAGNYSNDQVIPAGTDIYTILQNILCKELYPTSIGGTNANVTSSVGTPTIKLTKSGTVTYGTQVSISAITCGSLSVKTTGNTVTGLTYGYSAADDDSADSTSTTITEDVSYSASTSGNAYVLHAGFTGFTNQSALSVSGSSQSACKFDETAIGNITMGNNTIYVTQFGPKVTWSVSGIDSGYTVSNLGNTDSSKTYPSRSAKTNVEVTIPQSTASTTVVGVLPCFNNISNSHLVNVETYYHVVKDGVSYVATKVSDTKVKVNGVEYDYSSDTNTVSFGSDSESELYTATSGVQCSLITGKTFTFTVPSEVADTKHFMFDFPADRTVSSFKVKDLQGNWVTFEATYSQTEEVEKLVNGIRMNYKRLQTTGGFVGAGEYQITLSTNLNTATLSSVLK